MSIGTNIRRIREDRGISQETLAKRVGISCAMISQIEREVRNPSIHVGHELAVQLNCSMEDFFDSARDPVSSWSR